MTGDYPAPLDLLRSHRPAVAYAEAQREIRYEDLANDVERTVESLHADGIRPGSRVAWCPANDYASLVRLWAVLSARAVACPISPRFPTARRNEIVARLGAHGLPNQGQLLAGGPPKTSHGSLATIILSSGSSGDPKAVGHSLAAHLANAEGAASTIPLAQGDRWLWSLPMYHVSGLAVPLRCALAGATVCGTDASVSSRLLSTAGISHVSLVYTQLRRLLRQRGFPHHTLDHVLLGGSAFPSSLIEQAIQQGVPLHTTYGMTEMASQVATSLLLESPSLASGRVLPGREVWVCRNHEAADQSRGSHPGGDLGAKNTFDQLISPGEILVRGATLCRGYDVDGVMRPIVDADGWFHTGDLGELTSDNELYVLGRKDNMFVSGGENIYPEAIERALMDLPGIEMAVVVAQHDEEFGARPVAFVSAAAWRESEWRAQLADQLKGFEIPRAFLPLPGEGSDGIKPSRNRLQAMLQQK